MKALFYLIALLMCLLLLSSCAGGRMAINAKQAEFPISATPYLHTSSGETTNSYQTLTHFKTSFSRWSVFWTIIPFSAYEKDVSMELDNLIKKHEGNAIVNLTAKPDLHALNLFLQFFIGTFIPVIPSAITIYVEGDVVRYEP